MAGSSRRRLAWCCALVCAALLARAEDDANATYQQQTYSKLAALKSFAKGDFTVLVLHVGVEEGTADNATASAQKAIYYPKVDDFSELRATSTQPLIGKPDTSVRVWLEFPSSNLRSETRVMLRNDETGQRLVGSRSITIEVTDGTVTDLVWEDTCNGCTTQSCLEDSCSTETDSLDPKCDDADALKDDPYRCGLKIYVGWRGTDSKGVSLTSYTSMPLRFQKYSFVTSAYNAAAGFSSDFLSFWKKPLN